MTYKHHLRKMYPNLNQRTEGSHQSTRLQSTVNPNFGQPSNDENLQQRRFTTENTSQDEIDELPFGLPLTTPNAPNEPQYRHPLHAPTLNPSEQLLLDSDLPHTHDHLQTQRKPNILPIPSRRLELSSSSSSPPLPPSAPPIPSNTKPIRVAATPPVYTGSKTSDPYDFMNAYIRAGESNFWGPYFLVKQFPTFLRDKGLAWYESRTAERQRAGLGPWTWQELKSEFLNSNGPIEARQDQLEWKLMTIKQSSDETCSEFLIKIDNLCNRLDPKMSDKKRIKFCIRGLKKDALRAVNMHNPSTYSQLTELLTKYDETNIIINTANSDDEYDTSVGIVQTISQMQVPNIRNTSRPVFPTRNSNQIQVQDSENNNLNLSHVLRRIRNLELTSGRGNRYRVPNRPFRGFPTRPYRTQFNQPLPFQPYNQNLYQRVYPQGSSNGNNTTALVPIQNQNQSYLPSIPMRDIPNTSSLPYNESSFPTNYRQPMFDYQNSRRNQYMTRNGRYQPYRNMQNQRQPFPSTYPICYRCNAPGHFANQCRGSPYPQNIENLNSFRPRVQGETRGQSHQQIPSPQN